MSNRFSKKAIFVLFSVLFLFSSSKKVVFAETVTAAVGDPIDQFTLMPMFLPDSSGATNDELLAAMIKDQGYEAHCSAMQWTIDKKLLGQIGKFFSSGTPPEESFYNGLNPTIFQGVTPFIVDLTKARIPMFRGLEDKNTTMKNSSLEGMFGANYQETKNYMLNASGVSERLLSSYQQCVAKAQNIVATKKICDDVNGDCTIDKKYDFKIIFDDKGYSRTLYDGDENNLKSTESIADVSFKIADLLDWFQEIRPELKDEELYKQVCFDITGGDENNKSAVEKPKADLIKIAKLREAVSRVPIDLDTLYRIAFLVIVPTQNDGKDGRDDFYFLQKDPQVDSKVHAPIFIAFKIPEFATNKSKNAGNIDSLELTKMAIQPKEQNDKDLADQIAKREKLYELAVTQPDPVIGCPYPLCTSPLGSALIGIINGASLRCTNDTLRIIEQVPAPTKEREIIVEEGRFGWCRNCNPPGPASQSDWLNPAAEISGTDFGDYARFIIESEDGEIEKAAEEYAAKYDFDLSTWTFNEIDSNNPISGLNLTPNEYQEKASAFEFLFNQEDLNWERAGDLFTPASKQMKENTYKNPLNNYVAGKFKDFFSNDFEWKLTVDEDRPNLEAPMIVNAYLVLPIGENVKDANKAMTIFWSEETFFNMVKDNIIEDMTNDDGTSKMGAIPKFYTIKDAEFGIGTSTEIHPLDKCEMKPKQVKVNGRWEMGEVEVCNRYPFGFGFSDTASKKETSSKGELLIPDFGLGFMVRKIQQTLRASFNKTYDYIASCQRVEDMFLGRCKGDPIGTKATNFCKGEAFKNIKGIPSANGVPKFGKDIFTADVAAMLTPEHIEAYEYAEKVTGIPCEVVAGIHYTEAGLDLNKSVFSGAALGGVSLKDDAVAAMKHLISVWPGKFDKSNILYEELTQAIGNYNGPGNANCSSDKDNNQRITRWREGGKCEAQFPFEDHPHPLGYIDERHADMDLIYCMDFSEYSCQTVGTDTELEEIADHIREYRDENATMEDSWSEEKIASHLVEVKEHCFSGSPVCQNLSEGRNYPKYERPGSLTVAILLNELGVSH